MLFTLSDDKQVVNITFNNVDNCNALDIKSIIQLDKYITSIVSNKTIKLIIIRAEGKYFSSGADLRWMQQSIKYTKKQNIADAAKLGPMLLKLYNSNKVIICAIKGDVYGGAIGIVSCADIVIATKNVKFCFAEIKLGLAPIIISQFILKTINQNFAKYHILTAKPFNATQALQAGLVHKIIKLHALETQVTEYINLLLGFSYQGIITAKKIIRQQQGIISPKKLLAHAKIIAKLRTSATCQTLLQNFLSTK